MKNFDLVLGLIFGVCAIVAFFKDLPFETIGIYLILSTVYRIASTTGK